uniref:Cellulase domain-containing protein n=1 Tax=Globodera pallida TaxID=36090 RepID=A0A183C4J6_GLOPA
MAEEDVLNRLLNVSIEPNQAPAQNGNEDERRRVVEGGKGNSLMRVTQKWLERARTVTGKGMKCQSSTNISFRCDAKCMKTSTHRLSSTAMSVGSKDPYPMNRDKRGSRFFSTNPPEQRNVAAPFDDQINQGQAQQFRRGNAYPRSTEWAQPQQNTGVISSLEYNMVLERIPDLSGKEGSDEVKRFFKKFGAYTEDWPDQKRIKALENEFSIKFLIRAMGDPALSLNLELARTSGMPLDHFVSLAARAESTQRAVQRFSDERRNAVESRAPAFFQENRRQFETNTQSMRAPNRNFFATGANRTQPEAPNRDANMAKPSSSNFLKHNCIVTQQEKVHPDVCLSKIELMPEMNDFYENVVTSIENCSEKTLPAIGKVMAVKMEAYGVEADAMLDGGAQISLINANFLYQLVKEKRTNLAALEPSKVCARVLDVNGKLLTCLFAVKLKLFRRGLESPADIIAQVTKAPIGFDLLIGTNGLGKLGFKLYDEINDEMVPFETAKEKDKNFLTVIYRTTIEPRSTRTLEFEVGEGYENSEILATSEIAESVRVEPTVGIVREGKIVASITNLSLSAITLEERQQIGQIEPVQEIGESEDLLANPIISMVATQQTTEREAQVNVEANNWWSKQTGGLSEKEIEELQILTEQFFDILAVRDEELTQTNLVKHQIETGDAAPIKLRMRPLQQLSMEDTFDAMEPFNERRRFQSYDDIEENHLQPVQLLKDQLASGHLPPGHAPPYGRLAVSGKHLISKSTGKVVKLHGIVLYWSQWEPRFWKEFFTKIAKTYGNHANIIYEIWNEPTHQVTWESVIKSYAETMVDLIRQYDQHNVIIVPAPNWDQDVDLVAKNPLTGYSNIAYGLHFYAGTHGLPMFATEYGIGSTSTDTPVDLEKLEQWYAFLDERSLSRHRQAARLQLQQQQVQDREKQ